MELRAAESPPFQDEHSHRLSISWWSAPDRYTCNDSIKRSGIWKMVWGGLRVKGGGSHIVTVLMYKDFNFSLKKMNNNF